MGLDLGYLQLHFNWYNKRNNEGTIFERLNRTVTNHQWIKSVIALIQNLTILRSDHASILLNTSYTKWKT